MKVVQINAVCGKGSTGRICTDIAEVLIKHGHDCKILYGNGTSTYPHAVSVSNKWLVKLNALRARITGNDMGGSYISTRRIIRYLKQYRPDVVHLHNVHANFVNFPLLCRFLAVENIATVITMHDCWYFTGKCTHYLPYGCKKWKESCGNCNFLHAGIPSWFRDQTHKLILTKRKTLKLIPRLHIVGCSKWIINEARQSIGCCPSTFIYNGISFDDFSHVLSSFPKENECEGCELILGFANKWLLPENSKLFTDVINQLESNQRLVLIGCADNQIERINSLCSRIIALPFQNDKEALRDIYSACSLFVNASLADTLPTVCLEAQACGVPVIANKQAGIPETVFSKYGRIVNELTAERIFQHLRDLRKFDRKLILEECRRFVQQNFSKNENYLRYIEVYNSLAKHS